MAAWHPRTRHTGRHRVLAAVVALGAVTGCGNTAVGDAEEGTERTAELLVQVTSVHEETGMTLLEGPTLAPDGGLLVVDVTAPPGEPKVLRVDTESAEVTPVFTNEDSAYTSAQFSPYDDRLYLTDFPGGRIDSVTPQGEDHTTFFSGDVDGTPMQPDDLAFDEAGHMYVSDSTGFDDPVWEPRGRVVRIDRDTAEATVLADELPSPNGISFTEDFSGLWISHYTANRIDHLGLNEDGTEVETAHPAVYFDGGTSQLDSNAVDAEGNLYQAVHGQPSIFVYSSTGEHLTTVTVPEDAAAGLDTATNIAIEPGGTDAYMTVSGEDGGFVFTFEALGEGIRQSNGG
ncbi:SMP-30/gluconolactonase/LRE family protein [Nocardiopsis sp. MG754419]|uniref:SMP-30/gluconolactonase/LRE family protein n=1 Tax=Nocardiopsis sp. MG754419 TaxID=2259865 RepID=UPI001BAE189E|nr:SMP-30/gluconolactonase/LRE family protein [Nocardiopsis sp. MG754419]MBR8740796.1 SMP-30/gluconolactonase/LRE family protein [Nocardiopsis sp. MG754419]